jgi:hypothetical protein
MTSVGTEAIAHDPASSVLIVIVALSMAVRRRCANAGDRLSQARRARSTLSPAQSYAGLSLFLRYLAPVTPTPEPCIVLYVPPISR